MTGYAYMTASQKRGTIYIGVTNDLGRRMPEHKSGQGSRFTSRYGVQRLVWYEEHFDIRDAIQREKSLKRWPRQWKIELIEKTNPDGSSFFAEPGGSIQFWAVAFFGWRNGMDPRVCAASLRSLLRPRMTKWRGVSANPIGCNCH
ncbi:MAG: GIY-YIG nuclease family protein [Mesorhizobium sp.]|nr:MAG: GIY-YIG nuclease family protein [Mesorhizobium sp.]